VTVFLFYVRTCKHFWQVLPFISLVEEQNCQQEGCPQPYSFRHQMRLAPDASLFQRRVAQAPISGNIDNPEGGLDGLVQVNRLGQLIGSRCIDEAYCSRCVGEDLTIGRLFEILVQACALCAGVFMT